MGITLIPFFPMKNYLDKCRPLALAAGLLCAGGAVAQVVLVPAGCVVRVAGVGGNIGAGLVGNGGIVEMPDPYAGGNFGFSGGSVVSWNLLGDISEQTFNVPPVAPDQSAGAVTTVNIESYNKILRLSEQGTPSTNARSNGQVRIEYSILVCPGVFCNNVMRFDILKRWGNFPIANPPSPPSTQYAPPIVGPNCWGAGLINFQVDQVSSDNALDAIGFDQYYWTFTNVLNATLGSAAFYTSADRSAVVVDQSNSAFTSWLAGGGPYTVRCCFGRCNPWDGGADNDVVQNTVGNTCVTKIINPAATAPTFTTPIPTCRAWNTTTPFNAVFTGLTGHTYSWTSTCNWVLNQTGTVPGPMTLNVSGINNGPCTLTLTAVGPCGSSVYTYTVNRNFNTALLPTLTAGTTCTAAPGSFTIALPVVAQGNCTNWTISPTPVPAWTFTDANVNLRSIRTYTIPAGSCMGAFTITAANCSCPGISASVVMNIQPSATTLTGNSCVPYNVSTPLQVYNSTAPCVQNGTPTYIWANALGMTGSSTTSTISYAPVGTASGVVPPQTTVKLNAVGTNGCTGPAATINVNRTPPTPVVNLPVCVNVGLPGTATFSVAGPAPGMCYTWSFPSTFSTTTSATGTSVTIPTLGNTVGSPFPCSVTVNNCAAPFCGPFTTPFSVPVDYSTAVSPTNQATSSTVVATPGHSSYSLWNCTTLSVQAGPQAGNTFNLLTGPQTLGGYSYTVNITTLLGCVQRPPCVATNWQFMQPQNGINGLSTTGDAKSLLNDGSGVVLSPNPNQGRFTITLLREVQEATAVLFNSAGQQVGKPKRLTTGDNRIGEEGLAPGVYLVRMIMDGEVVTRQVAVKEE